MLTHTLIDGQPFGDMKTALPPDTSGSLVGALFEVYLSRQLKLLVCSGIGLAFYMDTGAGGVGNQPDIRHVLDSTLNIEVKTTRDRYVSQRPSSVRGMKAGYWLLSVRYDWTTGDDIVVRFGWVGTGDWGVVPNKGNRVRLPDEVYWDRHVEV